MGNCCHSLSCEADLASDQEDAIITTESRPASDVGRTVLPLHTTTAIYHFRRSGDHGLWFPSSYWGASGLPQAQSSSILLGMAASR